MEHGATLCAKRREVIDIFSDECAKALIDVHGWLFLSFFSSPAEQDPERARSGAEDDSVTLAPSAAEADRLRAAGAWSKTGRARPCGPMRAGSCAAAGLACGTGASTLTARRVGDARTSSLLRAAARRVRRGRRDRLGGGLPHRALPVRGLLQTFRGLSREPTRRWRWRVNGGRLSDQTVRLAQFQPTMCLGGAPLNLEK